MTVEDAFRNLEKYEAITENIAVNGGRVSEALANKLISAQIDYAVAKDNRHDPVMQEK